MKIEPIEIIANINNFLSSFEDQNARLAAELANMRKTANEQNIRKRTAENTKLSDDSRSVQKKYGDIINRIDNKKNSVVHTYNDLKENDSKFKDLLGKTNPPMQPVISESLDDKIKKMDDWVEDFARTYDEINQFKSKGTISKALGSKKVNELYSNLRSHYTNIVAMSDAITSDVTGRTNDDLESLSQIASQNINKIQMQYKMELEQINAMEIKDIDALAENAISNLDQLFEEKLIDSICREMIVASESREAFSNRLREEFSIGTLKFNVAEFCTNKGLVDLVMDKFDRAANDTVINIPFCVNIYGENNLLITHNEQGSALATEAASSAILSFLSSITPELFKLYVIDPQNKGRSVTPFLALNKCECNKNENVPQRGLGSADVCKCDKIIEIATGEEEIYTMLNALDKDIQFIIQEKLKNEFEDIWHYNEKSKSNPLKMKLVTLFDFPKGFSQRTYEMFEEIMENAYICGIYVILVYNQSIERSRYENHDAYLDRIFRKFNMDNRIQFSGGVLRHARTGLEFKPLNIPQSKVLNTFIEEFASRHRENFTKKGDGIVAHSFSNLHKGIFNGNSSECLEIPIGNGYKGLVNVEFGTGTSHHMIVAGATGSGKSTLLHTMILSLITKYSPEEINLYLMDFKSGTEFKAYDRQDIPHIRLLAIDAMQEFGESILQEICAEIERRSELFKDAGAQDLKGYVAMGNKLPRIVIIIDEFQTLFDESTNRAVAERCAGYASDIVAKGRSFGVHLIVSTQTMKVVMEQNMSLKNTTIDQMRSRIGMKCGEYDASSLFKEAAEEALEKMKGSIGKAVYSKEYTGDSPTGLMVTYVPDDEKKMILEIISNESKGKYDSRIRVFEGRREIEMPPVLAYDDKENVRIYMGEPVAVSPPIILNIGRRKSGNILVAGNSAKTKKRMEDNILHSLSKNPSVEVYAVEGSVAIGEGSSSNNFLNMKNKIKRCSSDKEIIGAICELYDVLSSRKSSQMFSNLICLYISDCQWLGVINNMFRGERVYDSMDKEPSDDVTPKMLSIIREGGAFGIFTVITSERVTDTLDAIGYPERVINNMDHRISFSLNEREADVLIGAGVKCIEKNGVAYYSDGIRQSVMFKPFAKLNK